MMDQRPTVALLDDDPSVRRSLERLIRAEGFDVAAFDHAQTFLESNHQDFSCLVLDVKMPGIDGMDLHSCLGAHGIDLPVIFLTGHGDVPMSVEAMKRGALDFLLKPVDSAGLIRAIRIAVEEGRLRRNARIEAGVVADRVGSLTPRELEVMRHVISGKLNKQVADALGISEKTVKVHRGRVMSKLGVVSVADLVRLSQKANIRPA
ncbi:MAG: response regulator transcription factor [Verrucomicrobiales bacterium]